MLNKPSKSAKIPLNKEARKVKEELILSLGAPLLAKALQNLIQNEQKNKVLKQKSLTPSKTKPLSKSVKTATKKKKSSFLSSLKDKFF